MRSGAAPLKAQGGVESKQGKANVLIQVCVQPHDCRAAWMMQGKMYMCRWCELCKTPCLRLRLACAVCLQFAHPSHQTVTVFVPVLCRRRTSAAPVWTASA